LWLRDAGARLTRAVADLRQSLARRAREHAATILPGVTHLQHAQAVSLGHVLLCYCDRLERDAGRLRDALERADVSPLGAGALAGTSLRIAPQRTARALGFPATFANSIDAVSDRDFAVEYVSACAILVTHLSQMAEDLILWSCPEFGFIELPDALTTSSSMLPQKKNPDLVELVRGKAGAVFGHLMSLLATLKALPIGYNRDLQETKPPLFAAAETALECVVAMERAVAGFVANTSRMLEAARDPGLLAIDLAESLVEKGVAFREAHGIVARLIRDCSEQGVSPAALSLNRLRGYSPAFDAEALRRLTPAASAARRLSPGGTAPILVARRARRLSRRSS
jgi:argininosuccinate lyase